jgi:hypothetical protein
MQEGGKNRTGLEFWDEQEKADNFRIGRALQDLSGLREFRDDRERTIHVLCGVANFPNLAEQYYSEGKTPDEVGKLLCVLKYGKPPRITPRMSARERNLRIRCWISKLSHLAGRYVASGKTRNRVGEELLAIKAAEDPVEIDTSESWKFRLPREIRYAAWESHLYQRATFDLLSSPQQRKQLLRIIDQGGPVTPEEKSLWMGARGMFRFVRADKTYTGDIDDYIKSRAWLKKFKPTKGGRPRQFIAANFACSVSESFMRNLGVPHWGVVAELVKKNLPSSLQVPTNATKSKAKRKSFIFRRSRWAKELVKRHLRWTEKFLSKPY